MTLERANLVASRVMGSVEYMRTIRQRYGAHGPADETDETMDASENENENELDIPVDPLPGSETLEGMADFLKSEHLDAVNRGELWDSNAMQSLILYFLEEIKQSSGSNLLARCRKNRGTICRFA